MNRIIIILGLYAVLSTSCNSSHGEIEIEAPVFQVTSPIRVDTSMTKKYVSQIRSINHIEVRALEKGYLSHIYVDEGQTVTKGQPMFQIMPLLYEAELQKANAETEFAKIEYLNTKSLAESNVVSDNELALAKAKLDKANAELSLAQVHLGFTKISAPFNGIMDRFHVRLGSLVDEGDLLTHLSDNSKMWVYFNVPEAEYLEYANAINKDSLVQVNLVMANKKLFKYPGIIETIEADFNNETGNIAFRATFPNPDGLLRHGGTGNILMKTALPNALLIPQKVTYEILDKKYVFVLDHENVVHSRQITIAAEMPHIYVVKDGLSDSDKILLEGLRLVRENEEIRVDFIEPKAALADLDLYAE